MRPFFTLFVWVSLFAERAISNAHGPAGPAHHEQLPILLPPNQDTELPDSYESSHIFSLRHIVHHGTHTHPRLHKQFDIQDPTSTLQIESKNGQKKDIPTPLKIKSRSMKIERLKDRRQSNIESLIRAAQSEDDEGFWARSSPSAWIIDEIPGPNVTDKNTVIAFANMTANCYEPEPRKGVWRDVGNRFNQTHDFGWENDGIRGYIYTNEDSSILVVTFKGTSRAVYDGGDTSLNDKENDNLLFGCCCGQGSYFYRQVCSCSTSTYTCNIKCVSDCMRKEDRYYSAATNLYTNITILYPNAEIWLAGHSLGGALSALVGLTYGVPVITFEAIPEAMPARRLGLPSPPSKTRKNTGAYHFGLTSDPVFMGTCNGASASCSLFGFSLESSCHTGNECIYDVVGDLGWRVFIGTHPIERVIDDVLIKYDDVPECKPASPECVDCALWKETEEDYSTTSMESKPTSTSTKTRTRTSTCETPGW